MGGAFVTLILAVGSPVKTDEVIVFFPTAGRLDEARGRWVVPVHGWIFEPERDSRARRRLLSELRDALRLDPRGAEAERFEKRAWPFLVDNERGKRVHVLAGGAGYSTEESAPNGHFRGSLMVPAAVGRAGDWLDYRVAVPAGDRRSFTGRSQLLGPVGLSVIADIDDTLKHSQVADLAALLANTFLREYRPVPGMPEQCRDWARRGAAFHYVSASPWQLHEPLSEFLRAQQIPPGSMHLQDFRWKDSTFWNLIASREEFKRRSILPLLEAFPRRRFVLVGDSGEKDPEIYGRLAREHPRQVVRVLIRHAGPGEIDGERLRRAFAGVPTDRWQVFREPREIAPLPFDGDER